MGLITALVVLVCLCALTFSHYYDRKGTPFILLIFIFSLIATKYWIISPVILAGFFYGNRMSYSNFAALNMVSAVLLSNFIINIMPGSNFILIAFASLTAACLLAAAGIFQDHLRAYLSLANAAQVMLIVTESSISQISGNATLPLMQLFNYTIAGLCLFFAIGVFAKNKTHIRELEGSVFRDKWNDAFATIACLSLAGLPLMNMFVSEWAFFKEAFIISPPLAMLRIFASIVLFMMYYKVAYALLVGEGSKQNVPGKVTLMNAALAASIMLLGMLPFLQFAIMGLFS